MKEFIQKEKHSFKFAFNGLWLLLKEKHIVIHLIFAFLAITIGFIQQISQTEWFIITICITMVLVAEAINTAIEKIVDYISLEKTTEAKIIKDIGAGMVLLTAISSGIIGAIIFFL